MNRNEATEGDRTSETWRLDMHCHTNHSPDCFMSPRRFVGAALRAGIDAVFVTDHERVSGYEPLSEAAEQAGGRLRVFPGQEVNTSRGEIIGLFSRERLPSGLDPEEAVARLRDEGALVFLPHPFARLVPSRLPRDFIEAAPERFDVVEAINARNIVRRHDRLAREFAERHGLLVGAGSDAHWPWDFGRAYVDVPPFDDAESLRRALPRGRLVDRGKSSYLLAGMNAAIYPFRAAWWARTGDPRGLNGHHR